MNLFWKDRANSGISWISPVRGYIQETRLPFDKLQKYNITKSPPEEDGEKSEEAKTAEPVPEVKKDPLPDMKRLSTLGALRRIIEDGLLSAF